MNNAIFAIIVAVAAMAANAATTATQPWVLNRIADATNALPSPDVSGQIGTFASTGTVFRAASVGTAEQWVDATGCVWRLERVRSLTWPEAVDSGNFWVTPADYTVRLSYTNSVRPGIIAMTCYLSVNGYAPISLDATPPFRRHPSIYDDTLTTTVEGMEISITKARIETNLVGRVAVTNEIPTTPGEVGAAPASIATTVAELGDTVSAWQTYWDGDDVRVTVTNYYGSLDIPHLYMEQRMPADETHDAAWFKIIWDEMTRWNVFLAGYATLTNHVARDLADRAWGSYDSSTGEYAPDGYTSISSSNILIAAGMAYQKTVTTDGEVWVLTATEPTTISGISTNGFFRITDGDGNALFEIVKGDKRTVGATAGGIRVDEDEVQIDYTLTDNSSVEIRRTSDLRSGTWETVDATWTGTSGAYTAHVARPSGPRAFFKATYEIGGETYIKNSAPVGFERVYIGGRSYRVTVETVSGKKLMVLNDD